MYYDHVTVSRGMLPVIRTLGSKMMSEGLNPLSSLVHEEERLQITISRSYVSACRDARDRGMAVTRGM